MKQKNTNLKLKIIAVILAVFLWLIVVNVNNPVEKRTFHGIPVEIIHEELITNQGMTFRVEDNTNNISVNIKAKRSVLDNIKSEDIVAIADVNNITLGELLPIKISVVGYDGRIVQIDSTPNNVKIKQEQSISNTFPIQVEPEGAVSDGFILKEATANPSSIKVMGPKSLVGRIDKVVAKINVTGLTKNTIKSSELIFYDGGGTILDTSSLKANLEENPEEKMLVKVDVEVLPSKVLPIKIDGSKIKAKIGYKIAQIYSEPQEIRVAGKRSLLKKTDEIVIPPDAIVIEGISAKSEETIDISMYMPEGLMLADEKEKNIVVSITPERLGMKTFNIPISAIRKDNLAKGMKAEILGSQEIQVDFTGEDKELEKLREEDIQDAIYIDMKDLTREGDYKIPVKVDIKGCYLAEEITVNVELTK